MNPNAPTEQDIVAALRSSGYLNEQRIATVIENFGYHVETGRPFEDQDQGTSREIDVWGFKLIQVQGETPIDLAVELICECKSGTTNPLVFLTRPKNAMDLDPDPQEYLFPVQRVGITSAETHRMEFRPTFKFLRLRDHHYYYRRPEKAVQFVKMVREKGDAKGPWKAQHDGIFDALFFPLAKAVTARKREVEGWFRNPDPPTILLFFPLILYAGELFTLDTTTTVPIPLRTEHVTFARELAGKTIKGRFVVEFLTVTGLTEFLTSTITPLVEYIEGLALTTPTLLLTQEVQVEPGGWRRKLIDGRLLPFEAST
jgi:hypothetical protein